jgi:hypothetical protein
MFQTANLRIFFGIYADVDKKNQTSVSVTIAPIQIYTVFSYFCQLFSNHPEKRQKDIKHRPNHNKNRRTQ